MEDLQVIAHDFRGSRPLDIPVALIHAVEIESTADGLHPSDRWTHRIPHPFKGYVIAQFFDRDGRYVPIPGAGRTWIQVDNAILIPVLNERYYPIKVVMIG